MRRSTSFVFATLLAVAFPVRAEDALAPAFPAQQRMAEAQTRLRVLNDQLDRLVREHTATRAAAEATVREVEALTELLKANAPKDEKEKP